MRFAGHSCMSLDPVFAAVSRRGRFLLLGALCGQPGVAVGLCDGQLARSWPNHPTTPKPIQYHLKTYRTKLITGTIPVTLLPSGQDLINSGCWDLSRRAMTGKGPGSVLYVEAFRAEGLHNTQFFGDQVVLRWQPTYTKLSSKSFVCRPGPLCTRHSPARPQHVRTHKTCVCRRDQPGVESVFR